VRLSLLTITFLASSAASCAEQCLPLNPVTAAKLAQFVSRQYETAPDVSIVDQGTVADSCFRRLQFDSASPRRSIVLYLSPDQRFLFNEMLDSSTNPEIERERVAEATEIDLLRGRSPGKGPEDAEITIVEFSDFQCPFCRTLNQYLNVASGAWPGKVRVLFKQMPLPIHSWAKKAALAAICASRQSDEAFWRVADLLFAAQDKLNADNFDEQFESVTKWHSQLINHETLHTCLASHEADAVLERDQALASQYRIAATPTVFINGVRHAGFRNEGDVVRAIEQAEADRNRKRTRGAPIPN